MKAMRVLVIILLMVSIVGCSNQELQYVVTQDPTPEPVVYLPFVDETLSLSNPPFYFAN